MTVDRSQGGCASHLQPDSTFVLLLYIVGDCWQKSGRRCQSLTTWLDLCATAVCCWWLLTEVKEVCQSFTTWLNLCATAVCCWRLLTEVREVVPKHDYLARDSKLGCCIVSITIHRSHGGCASHWQPVGKCLLYCGQNCWQKAGRLYQCVTTWLKLPAVLWSELLTEGGEAVPVCDNLSETACCIVVRTVDRGWGGCTSVTTCLKLPAVLWSELLTEGREDVPVCDNLSLNLFSLLCSFLLTVVRTKAGCISVWLPVSQPVFCLVFLAVGSCGRRN